MTLDTTHILIHTAPIDATHKIEVYENIITHKWFFFPYYLYKGRLWVAYKSGGQRVAYGSYASAKHHIDRSNRRTA